MNSADTTALVKKHPIGFACGSLSAILAVLIYYRGSTIEENQSDYETKSAEAAKIISNVSFSKNLPEQVAEIQAQTKGLESRLVHAGQLAVNLQYFYKLEAETEVKLMDIRQSTVPKSGSTIYSGVPYNVAVQGTYKQIMIFLNRLENGRHLCRFSSVIFTKVNGGGDNSSQNIMILTLNLELLGQP